MLDIQIRQKLNQYLNSEITLREFQRWFVPATWDAHLAEPSAMPLIGEVELLLAEYTSDHLTESEIRNEFRALANTYTLLMSSVTTASIFKMISGTSAETLHRITTIIPLLSAARSTVEEHA